MKEGLGEMYFRLACLWYSEGSGGGSLAVGYC